MINYQNDQDVQSNSLLPFRIIEHPTDGGLFYAALFPFEKSSAGITSRYHIAIFKPNDDIPHDLVIPNVLQGTPIFKHDQVLTRLHSECLLGDALGSIFCDCRQQLQKSFQAIANRGEGIILYLRQEGRGIGLEEKFKCLELIQGRFSGEKIEEVFDTYQANEYFGHKPDERDFQFAASILRFFQVESIILLGKNPAKAIDLESQNLHIVEHLAVGAFP